MKTEENTMKAIFLSILFRNFLLSKNNLCVTATVLQNIQQDLHDLIRVIHLENNRIEPRV